MHRAVIRPVPDSLLAVTASDDAITGVWFLEDEAESPSDHPLIREASRQLELYFAGRLRDFDLPLSMQGTPFQLRVWETLRTIPYGQTISYAELAQRTGSPKGFRAVGAANGKNPIPIIVPCHRVINSGGGLGGFSCGIAYKRRLLDLESGSCLWTS